MTKILYLAPLVALMGCGSKTAPQPSSQQAPAQSWERQVPPPAEDAAAAPSGRPSALAPDTQRQAVPSVTIPRGATLRVRLGESVSTTRNRAGDRFSATLDRPVEAGGKVVIPRGTTFTGHITNAAASGRLRGRASIGLTLDSFRLDGKTYRIETSSTTRVSASHKKRNIGFIGGLGGLGAALGAIAGGGKGALIGAGAGAAAGTAGAALTGKRNVSLPAETLLSFSLRAPVTL
ncbi:MAG: hypothetical protein M1541_21610 [Acidobacteria bacterium]|nr:hypothetical protein [Acidobacteriota bacterium]